jgi:hypothetical protein
LAVELVNVRSERDRLVLSEDRERIVGDLRDLLFQRLFGAGLRAWQVDVLDDDDRLCYVDDLVVQNGRPIDAHVVACDKAA